MRRAVALILFLACAVAAGCAPVSVGAPVVQALPAGLAPQERLAAALVAAEAASAMDDPQALARAIGPPPPAPLRDTQGEATQERAAAYAFTPAQGLAPTPPAAVRNRSKVSS